MGSYKVKNCKNCGLKVLSQAKECHHCGASDPGKKISGKDIFVIGSFVFCTWVLWLTYDGRSRDAIKIELSQEQKDKNCRKSASCYASSNLEGELLCANRIQNNAKYDYEWTDKGIFNFKFPHISWVHQEDGIVAYQGDSIKFFNGFGAKVNYKYKCMFDVKSGKVVEVFVSKGYLM